jgi:hypothetical protein
LQSVVDAVSNLGPVATILVNPLQNVVNVLNIPTDQSLNVLLAASGLIGPLVEAPAAAATALQGVIDAVKTGDAGSVLSAVVDAPAVIAGGVLNGGLGPNIGDLVAPGLGLPPGIISAYFGGLLSPALSGGAGPDGLGLLTSGTIAGLQTLQGLIADALKPPTIPVAAKTETVALASTDTAATTPTALPSLKSALVGLKTPLALKVKPTKATDPQDVTKATDATATTDTTTTDTKATDTKPADTKASDTKPAASDAGDTGNKPAKTPGKHRASAGDNGGRHARSHDSSGAGAGKSGKSGSGSGRHHAA